MERHQLLLILLSLFCAAELTAGGIIFGFAFNFHIKSPENATDATEYNKTVIVRNNEISVKDTENSVSSEADNDIATGTVGPTDAEEVNAMRRNLNTLAGEKLDATIAAINAVNNELRPLVGRYDSIAGKVKLTTRYLNEANAARALTQADMNDAAALSAHIRQKFETLRKFEQLIEALRGNAAANSTTAAATNAHVWETVLMKALLDRQHIFALQTAVQQDILAAEQAWQQYVREQLIEVTV